MRAPLATASPNFAAALLAGGRSTRMGFDKATLILEGQPLWQRQLATLRALHPRELFISGRRDGPYAGAGVEIIEDEIPDLGPLGGIASVLRRVASDLVVILAIDLPAMTSEYLITLMSAGRPAIPHFGKRFEPMAALYSRDALPIIEQMRGEDDRSMQRLARKLCEASLAQPVGVAPLHQLRFQNVNCAEDLANLRYR